MNSIIVKPDDKIWQILDKEDDRTCTLKNLSTGDEFSAIITSINSRGIYTISIVGTLNVKTN